MALLDAITQFVNEFNREKNNLGILTLLAEERTVPEELLLNGQLLTFYTRVEFEKLVTGDAFDWAPLHRLPQYQEGWGIIYDENYPDGIEDTKDWNANWLVFGDLNGDAIFTKLDDAASPVFGSIQKYR